MMSNSVSPPAVSSRPRSHSPVNHLCTATSVFRRRTQMLRSLPVCSIVLYTVSSYAAPLMLIFEAVLETSSWQFSGRQHRKKHKLHQILIKLITSKTKLLTSPSGVLYETVRRRTLMTLMISELVWALSHQHNNRFGPKLINFNEIVTLSGLAGDSICTDLLFGAQTHLNHTYYKWCWQFWPLANRSKLHYYTSCVAPLKPCWRFNCTMEHTILRLLCQRFVRLVTKIAS